MFSPLRAGLKSALLAASLSFLAAAASAETITLRFVQTNDIDRMEERDGRGGFAKLAAVAEHERAEGTTFLVHSGDTISPSLLSGIDKGVHQIDILNQMGIAVMTPGNHEFDFGKDVFHQRIGEAKFPIVTSNVREADGSQPANTVDDLIVEADGIKIGFYGLTTWETPDVAWPGDITFADEVETAKKKQTELKEKGAEFIVAVIHSDIVQDMEIVRNGYADLVLSGHDEHLMTFYNGKTALTESFSQADYVVVTTITLEKTVKDRKTEISWKPAFDIVDTIGVHPEPKIEAIVQKYKDKLDQELAIEIGATETALDSRRATVRSQEAAIGNLIADAMRERARADAAIMNGGGIRGGRLYPAGSPVTRRDVLAELAFGNHLVLVPVKGADLREAIENGLSRLPAISGRFPHVSGMRVEFDPQRSPGSRVLSIEIGGALQDPDRIYRMATNNFMARGGDGYSALTHNTPAVPADDAPRLSNELMVHLRERGTVRAGVDGRMRAR